MNVRTVEPALERPTSPAAPAPPGSRLRPAGRAVRVCAALFAASLLLAVIGNVGRVEALALIGGYGVVFLGVGAAPFQLRTSLDLYARVTGAALVGFSVLLGAGALMADLRGLWHPVLAALVVGVPAIVLHAIGVVKARPGPYDRWLESLQGDEQLNVHRSEVNTAEFDAVAPRGNAAVAGGDAGATPRQASNPALTRQRIGLHWTLVGTVFWLAAALWTRDPSPGYWGMLVMINPLWYAGLAILLLGFAVGRRDELAAGLATLSFGLATTLTPALVYGAPREPAAAKQMQITQFVLTHHHIDVTAGIYQAFSSTFSGVAALVQLLGIHGVLGHMSLWSVATYWPVLLVLLRVGVLRFLMGRLLPTTSRRWCGVMLVLLVDSLGNDYFSPQSIGYVVAIGIVAIAMNGLKPRPFGPRTTFLLLLLAGMALAPTHELSPYMAAGALIVLAFFGQAPFWACLPVAVPALCWAGIVNRAVSQNFNFGALFNIGNFRPPVTVATPGLHRLAVVGTQSHLLLLALLILILLGATGFLGNIRRKWAWAYALCPIVGIGFIAINPYGNEGIFRATLFAIPWMAVLAMRMPQPARLIRPFRRFSAMTGAVAVVLGALLGTFLIAAYAMDGTMVLPASNVAVTDYLMHQPPRNAYVLSIGSADNPTDGATFTMNYHTLEWVDVASRVPQLDTPTPTAANAVGLAERMGLIAQAHGASQSSPMYVVWSRSSSLYDAAYGLQSRAQSAAWLRALKTSPSWRLVDHRGGTYLFRLT